MIQLYLKRFLLVISISFCCAAHAQTTLSAGDIAFTGYDADDNTVNGASANDDFSFILLKNIVSGTTIYFTDFGWASNTNAFQTANACGASTGALSDGVVRWVATADMNYGAQVTIRCRLTPSANRGTATGFQATYNVSSEYMSLAVGGDQIIAFQGSLASPTLLAAMGMNGAWDGTLTNCTFSSSLSVLPPALNSNNCAFNIVPEIDNARLKTSVTLTGVAATDRAVIHNSANWDVHDATAFALPAPIITLPVNFVRFSALQSNGAVKLVWDVADEINLHGYKVQRSTNGSVWEDLILIPATHASGYSWTDALPGTGKHFYRICSVDIDGRLQYTRVIASDAGASATRITATPNPFHDFADVNINLAEGAVLSMQLVGTNGQKIWEYRSSLPAGAHVIRINEIARFAPGVYQLLIKSTTAPNYQTISIVKQ